MNIQTIKNWWENLLDRERQMLTVGGIVVGILVIYAAIWTPLSNAVQDRKMAVMTQQRLLNYLQKSSATIQQLKAEGVQASVSDNVDLLSLTEQSLSQEGLSSYLKQVQQPEKNHVALTFEKVPFDKLMQWLQEMTTSHGVSVTQLNASRLPEIGTANVTLIISTAAHDKT
jgi:general secretion pathway protein M